MPNYTAPNKDFQFLIDHFLELEKHQDVPGFAEAAEIAPALLDESAKLCQDVLHPLNQVGDTQGLKYENGNVITPEGFKEAYQMYVEGGWPTLTWPTEFGGQDMPEFVNMPLLEIVYGRGIYCIVRNLECHVVERCIGPPGHGEVR